MIEKLAQAQALAPLFYVFSALAGAAVAAIIGTWRAATGLRGVVAEDVRTRTRPILSARLCGSVVPGAMLERVTVKNFGAGPAMDVQVHVAASGGAWRESGPLVLAGGEESGCALSPVLPTGGDSGPWVVLSVRYGAVGGERYERRMVLLPGANGAWHLIQSDEKQVGTEQPFPAPRAFGRLPGPQAQIPLLEEQTNEA